MSSHPPAFGAVSGNDRAPELAELLRQATQASLDPDAVLEVVVRWCARVLGDLAVVRVLTVDGERLERRAAAHRDATREVLALEDPAAGHLTGEALTAEVLATLETRMAPAASGRRGDSRFARAQRSASAGRRIVAPLRSRGRALGVLDLRRERDAPPYEAQDVALLDEAATRIGLVFDNARLYERVRLQAATLEHVDTAICALGADGRITSFNPAAERMFGWAQSDVLDRLPATLLWAEPPQRLEEAQGAVIFDGVFSGEWRLRRRDGERFLGHVTMSLIADDRGGAAGTVIVFADLSERLRLIAQLERRAAQQSAVAALGERALEAQAPPALIATAVEAVRTTLHVDIAAVFGLTSDGRELKLLAGAGFDATVSEGAAVPAGWQDCQEGFTLIRREPVIVDDARRERRFEQAPLIASQGVRSGVTVVVQGRGGPYAVLSAHSTETGVFVADDVAFLQSIANVLGDALDRHGTEEEVRQRALHDPLTELPNRSLVMDRLQQAAQRLERSDSHVALVFLDLDHFKLINDNLGHRAGDAVLREVADRLRAAVRPADTVGRFGGDEFIILCEDVEDEAMALSIAERLSGAFAEPFHVGGDEHRLGASLGIALLEGHQDADELLRDADAAMYRAKERGRARIEVFDEGMRDYVDNRLQTEAALRRALENDELVLFYQPIIDLDDGAIAAVEALVRWRHPERGLLEPDAFVPVAEECGLIVGLGRRVLELACAQAAEWTALRPGHPPLPVHVNLSPRQLQDQALIETVRATLAATGADPSALALEITESTLIDRGPERLAMLEQLRDLGVALVLDDFGTGWSSLSYLAQLPVGGLKIDRSFVAGLADGQGPIVDAILRMARAFALPVVAEGIEDARQLLALRRLGCGLGQGHLFSRAVAAEELTALIAAPDPPYRRDAEVSPRPRAGDDRA